MSKLSRLLAELKRRKVYRAGAVYVVVGVGVLGAAEVILDPLGLSGLRAPIVILVLLGFPIALALAWAYELRPEEPASQARPYEFPGNDVSAETAPVLTESPDRTESPEPQSIAVLPFANRSGSEEDLHFTDGMHDQIISQLFKVGSLSVRGRTSVEVYRDSPKNLRSIGQELNARYLMEGGVQRAGERVRIIVQLIDAESDEHLWAEEYDRSLSTENLFDVQSEIALAVTSELKAVLTPEEKARIQSRPTESLEAYEAFLRGRQHMARQTSQGILRATREFEAAVQADPNYAMGRAALANAYLRTVTLHEALDATESAENLRRAKEEADRALELDPSTSEAHVVLAIRAIQWYWDWEAARDGLLRAMELNPSDALAHAYYAVYLAYREHRLEEARRVARSARELDPFDPFITSYWVWCLWASGDYPLALEEARKAADVWPEKPFTHYWTGLGLLWTGGVEEAITEFETAVQLGGRMTFFLGLLAGALALAEREEEARAVLKELKERSERGAVLSRWIAAVHAALGEGDEAMEWLQRAVEEHDPTLFHALTDPFFQAYREDPRFLAVMDRIGLTPMPLPAPPSATSRGGGP